MERFADTLLAIATDRVMFSVLQVVLITVFFIALAKETWAKHRAGKGSATLSVERGKESMAKFYGAYLAINGLLIAICLSVEVVKGYRIFWVVIDTLIPAYICILNPWSRNKLIGWADTLRKIEAR